MYVQIFIPVGLFKNFLQLLKVKEALFGTPTLVVFYHKFYHKFLIFILWRVRDKWTQTI